jgi:hypothetical protein
MATETVKMTPGRIRTDELAHFYWRGPRGRRATRRESPSSSFVPRKPTADLLLPRPRAELLAFWPKRRGSTPVLERTKLAPDGGAHAQL